jgi:hypothetical protein
VCLPWNTGRVRLLLHRTLPLQQIQCHRKLGVQSKYLRFQHVFSPIAMLCNPVIWSNKFGHPF